MFARDAGFVEAFCSWANIYPRRVSIERVFVRRCARSGCLIVCWVRKFRAMFVVGYGLGSLFDEPVLLPRYFGDDLSSSSHDTHNNIVLNLAWDR